MEEYIFRYRSYVTSRRRFQIFQAWALAAAKDESDEARRNTSVVEGQLTSAMNWGQLEGLYQAQVLKVRCVGQILLKRARVVVPCL